MDLDSQRDMGQLLHREGRKEMSGIQESLRVPLSVTSPLINVHGKLHQPNPGRTKEWPGPFGNDGWPHYTRKSATASCVAW